MFVQPDRTIEAKTQTYRNGGRMFDQDQIKAVEEIAPIHQAQILSYMKLSGCPVGLLINFNVPVLTQGIKRFRL